MSKLEFLFMEYPATHATVETLPNGLTLILDPDPAAPVVSAQCWVATGSIHEDDHLGSGLSHFLEHMVFKGTRDYDGDQLADAVQAAGGHWNAYTTFDRTVYYIDGPASSLPEFLKILNGLVFFPTLPESEFEKEKDVIRREIDMGLDDPDHVATRMLLASAFALDPRRHPVIGHRHLFDGLLYDDLVTYHRKRYTPDRCHVVISGDFDPDQAREQILRLSSDAQMRAGREPLIAHDPPQLGPRRARETFAIPASRISLVWKTPPLDHPDTPAYDALAAILGRGRASRFHRRLRDERELALEISAYSWTSPGREGLLVASADAEPAKRDELINAIFNEVASITSADLDDELAKAQRQIASSQFRTLTTASGRAADLGSNWHEARDLDFTRRYLASIQEVKPDDVRRVAASLVESRSTLAILDPLDAPLPGRSAKVSRRQEEIETCVLPNGLTLALLPDRRVPLVQLQAAARAGLLSETLGTNGINQLLAASLPKGTHRRTAHELSLTLESLGASIGAAAGNNALLVQAGGLAPDLATIVEVFADVLKNPAFPADAVAREKASQLASLEEALNDPLHQAFRSLRQSVFCGTGYGLDSLGTPASIAALDREALAAHHARHLNAGNMAVVLVGDFDAKAAREMLEETFTAHPAGGRWEAPLSSLAVGARPVSHLPKKQAVIVVGFPGAGIRSADRHALAMLQEFASDMAGPLFTRLREELGLAYQVGATQFLGYDSGLFSFYIATSPEQAEQARDELLAEIGKIAAAGIPDDTFERVRSTVLSGLAIQQQSPSSVARLVALDLLFGHPADEYRRLAGIYGALSPHDIRQVAANVFSATPTIATVLPENP
jgi:zinc protease